MSRSIKRQTTVAKPFCKVCHDAGKPESIFTSHYVKSGLDTTKSKIDCPTLLALECRYCYQNGHTVKYCVVLKKNEKIMKEQTKNQRKSEFETKTMASSKDKNGKTSKKNRFASFCESTDGEEEKEEKEVKEMKPTRDFLKEEEFPQLNSKKNIKKNEVTEFRVSFASIALEGHKQELSKNIKHKKEPRTEPEPEIVETTTIQVVVPEPFLRKHPFANKSWADYSSDSDSDDDEEEEDCKFDSDEESYY